MKNDDLNELIKLVAADTTAKCKKYESLNKQAIQAFDKNDIENFIKIYNQNLSSIDEKISALSTLMLIIDDSEKIFKFREMILNSDSKEFLYLYDYAMFQSGIISPEEIIKSVEEGISQNVPLAYAIKSFFYRDALDNYESSKLAIEQAILLEPENLEYKMLLKELNAEINYYSF